MNPHTTLNLAKIALCAVETVLRILRPMQRTIPSQLNKITTLQVLIVRLLQMQQHKTDISSIKKSSRLQFEPNSKTSYALPS